MTTLPLAEARPGSPELFRRETKSPLRAAIERAERDIEQFTNCMSGAWRDAEPLQDRALGSAYAVCHGFKDDPEGREFYLQKAGVKPHAAAKNPQQPLVKALFNKCERDIRSRITKYAGAIALALSENVKPKAFTAFTKAQGGIEAAYREWARRQRRPKERLAELQKKKSDLGEYLSGEPVEIPVNDHTAGRTGLVMYVARVNGDQVELLRALDMEPKEVEALILRFARKAKAHEPA